MYAEELQVALKAARAAAAAVREVYERPSVNFTEKDDGKGPLTEADLAANALLIEHLSAAFPNDAILSEETVDSPTRLANARCWILDPLDGTREFTQKVPQFVVSVGLAVDGQIAVGVLVNPATGEEFTGVVGVGATYNGEPCQVTQQATLEGATLLVSASEYKKGWFDHLKGVAELQPVGSVAYKFGLVAAGRADATFTPKPRNEWDLAGGVACILAAGGETTDGKAVRYTFNRPDPLHIGVAGTNGALHGAVMDLIQR
ncbi:MAG: 3'(2'),5'-bisphosphate nucleotidase CysQ [Myxococcota bacterium]